jgi:hypothetical protein
MTIKMCECRSPRAGVANEVSRVGCITKQQHPTRPLHRHPSALPAPHSHLKTLLRIEPCTPQLASTTCVTPKSAATDISEMASSSLK